MVLMNSLRLVKMAVFDLLEVKLDRKIDTLDIKRTSSN